MKNLEIAKEILTAIYKEIGVEYKDNIDFEKYSLKQERQDAIMEEILKKYKLTKLGKSSIKGAVWLGNSPKGN